MGKSDGNKLGISDHPKVVDEQSLKTSLTPGKKGGVFPLPFGANISLQELSFGKKDTVSCRVVSPPQRWAHGPGQLPSYERVISEIFVFKSSVSSLKKPVVVQFPFLPVDTEFDEINVKGKWSDSSEWVDVGFLIKEGDVRQLVELELTKFGTFFVTCTPKSETFEVTNQGCLYQARLSRHISVRFPKKTIDQTVQCTLQIHPILPVKMQASRDMYPSEMADLVTCSEFIDVIASAKLNFRRAVTVKLPLPVGVELEVEGGGDTASSAGHQDIAVLYKSVTGWELVESEYKFTRMTASFDIKHLSRFCVVRCVEGRQKKMKEALNILEGRNDKEKGEICLFLSIKNKSWQGLIEVMPRKISERKISDRKSQGFTLVSKIQSPIIQEVMQSSIPRRRQLPPPPRRNSKEKVEEDGFEIYEGLTWLIDVDGDVKVSQQSDLRENNHLKYYSKLGESFRVFNFEPLGSEIRTLEGVVNLVPLGIRNDALRNELSFTFNLDLNESIVSEFLAPEPIPEEVQPEKPKIIDTVDTVKVETPPPAPPVVPKVREVPPVVMQRLTTVTRPIRVPERESRALSGKSLMTLARLIPEGLTLAVHLQLPDSTITGIGFDALSNNLNMSDVSYKILLHWKRKCKDKQNGAVNQLTEALREMNYGIVADAVLGCHQQKKEFLPDCLTHEEIYSNVGARS